MLIKINALNGASSDIYALQIIIQQELKNLMKNLEEDLILKK